MSSNDKGTNIDPAAIIARLPALRAALAEGKTAIDYVLFNVPEQSKPDTLRRKAIIEQGLQEVAEMEKYLASGSSK